MEFILMVALIATVVYLTRKTLHLNRELRERSIDERFDAAYRHTDDRSDSLERKLETNTKYLESNWQSSLDAIDRRFSEDIAELKRTVEANYTESLSHTIRNIEAVENRIDAIANELEDLRGKGKK